MALGDIGSVINTLEWATVMGGKPRFCHHSGNLYVVAHRGVTQQATLTTFTISDTGILSAVIDSWIYYNSACYFPHVLKIRDNFVLAAYSDDTYHGHIGTVEINSNGTIEKHFDSEIAFNGASSTCHDLIRLENSNTNAMFWEDENIDANATLVLISASDPAIVNLGDAFILDADRGTEMHSALVSGQVHAVTWRGGSEDLWVGTVRCTLTTLPIPRPIATLKIDDSSACFEPRICKARSGYFAIVYRGAANDAYLKIVSISPDGVTITVTDTYEFDATICYQPDIVSCGLGYIAAAYMGDGNTGWLKSFYVDSSGHLNSTTLSTLEFETVGLNNANILRIQGDYYATLYTGPGGDGFCKTLTIESPSLARPRHGLMMGIGP